MPGKETNYTPVRELYVEHVVVNQVPDILRHSGTGVDVVRRAVGWGGGVHVTNLQQRIEIFPGSAVVLWGALGPLATLDKLQDSL